MSNIPAYTFRSGFSQTLRTYGDDLNFTYHIASVSYPINHTHNDYWEFTIVMEGELVNYTKTGKQHYPKNTMFITPSHKEHYLLFSKPSTQYMNIVIRETYLFKTLDSLFPNMPNFLLDHEQIYLSEYTVQKIAKILYSTNIPKNDERTKIDLLLLDAFLIILQNVFDHFLKNTHKEVKPDWFLKVEEIIDSEESPSLSVNELSERLNYSRAHLSRLFKSYLNVSPYEYLLEIKMTYAQNLLINTDLNIIEIAERLSYSHVSQFCKTFKTYFDLTPKDFRLRNKPTQH